MGRTLLVLVVALLLQATASSSQQTECNPRDLEHLQAFANGLLSAPVSWLSNNSSSSSSKNCCQWVGVSCDNSSGRVTELQLANMGLRGSISSNSLGVLDYLTNLNLANNSLTGSVPPEVFKLSRLEILNLSCNNLTGNISAGLSLPSIRYFNISCNRFTGVLPDSLFNSASLEKLLLQSNQLEGSLSSKIGDLTNLTELDISSNKFSGLIPDVFGGLKHLRSLSFSSNSFNGSLPSSLSRLSSIQVLNLNRNSFRDQISLNFSNMPQLTNLDLGSNFFNGVIPSDLSSCLRLKTINLARNNLKGEVPRSFMGLTALQSLSLSNNSFTNISSALETLQHCPNLITLVVTINFKGETLPSDGITGFKSLQLLVAANCALSGTVPAWLSQCMNLRLVDLSWNKLYGSVPSWFDNLGMLFYIDLSNNTLTGEIPLSLTNISTLMSSNASQRGSSSADVPFFSKQGNRLVGLQYNQIGSFPPTIDLSYNDLTGPIPPQFGNLKKLHILDLSNNNLTGSIPEELSKMVNLETLDLSTNHLNGSIPAALSSLSFLSKFNVSYNNLVGRIPTGTQFSTFNSSSYMGNSGLCGIPLDACKQEQGGSSSYVPRRKTSKGVIAGIVLGILFGMLLLIFFVYLAMAKTHSRRIDDTERDRDLSLDSQNYIEQTGSSVVLFQAKEPNSLSIDDILKSTGNFDQANIIGCGGFGLVYKATFPNDVHVAIKRLSGEYGQMEREFQAEVETLSRARHVNLVSLQGYCKIGNDRLLIYSYMENGSLDYWLHENEQALLDWATRLRIARGSARGLAYLHQSCDPHILHRDIKSSNILLDSNFEAHLADFGLARLMLPSDTHVTTDLVGTLGYIPPEYAQSPVATMKGDVYSFGVVLLELLTGRRPMDICRPKEHRDLISWVVRMREEGREMEVFDGSVYEKKCAGEMKRVLEISCRCLRENPKERPLIHQIVAWLNDVDNDLSTC